MPTRFGKLLALSVGMSMILATCTCPASMVPAAQTATAESLARSVEQTVSAAVAVVSAPTAAPDTPAPPPPSITPPPPTPTEGGPTPTAGDAGCIDRASFIADVTYPDDSPVDADEVFEKIWRLRNDGTCTWSAEYALVFDHGDRMSGGPVVPLSGNVAPGDMVDLSVELEAPEDPGTYQGFWKLRNDSGVLFGVGSSGNVAFWVRVIVPGPTMVFEMPPWFLVTLVVIPGPANYTAAFQNVHGCGPSSSPYATFRLENTGSVTFESASLHIQDLTAGSTLYGPAYSNSPFLSTATSCPAAASAFGPSTIAYVAAYIGATTPSGHSGRATIRLCSGNGMTGDCVERIVNFTYP